jgi:hypothetical protein
MTMDASLIAVTAARRLMLMVSLLHEHEALFQVQSEWAVAH